MLNRWSKEEVEFLKSHALTDKIEDIANHLNRSIKAVELKITRLKISLKNKQKRHSRCLNCNTDIVWNACEKRKFCNKSCAATYNNKNRVGEKRTFSEEGLENIRISNRTQNRRIKSKQVKQKQGKQKRICEECGKEYKRKCQCKIIKKESKERICKNCLIKPTQTHKKAICDDCRNQYYKYYRPSCEFRFIITEYAFWFSDEEVSLLKKYGMYSPTNKKNNLKGVSRDHLYSVADGFKNGIQPEIISHPANCRFILHEENNRKKTISSISYEELLSRIDKFNTIRVDARVV